MKGFGWVRIFLLMGSLLCSVGEEKAKGEFIAVYFLCRLLLFDGREMDVVNLQN
jgi:hypothetical protein